MKRLPHCLSPAPLHADYADAGDFLRVACIALVGWFHIWQQSWLNPNLVVNGHTLRIYPIVACGYMFVDLMLMLSGFLLMLGWLNGRGRDLRAFYVGRAARILPSYLLCIGVMLFAFALPNHEYSTPGRMWKDILTHLTFTHNFFYETYLGTRLNGVLWTLAVEVQFYLIFPLLARAFERSPAAIYCGMAALGLCVRIGIALTLEDSSLYFNRLGAMLDVYANGMLAAYLYKKLAEKPQSAARAFLSTLLTVAAAALICRILNAQFGRGGEDVRRGQMFWRFPLSALGAVFALCGSRSVAGLRALFSNRVMRFLSGVSFNFYIWHQFLAVRLKALRIPPYTGDAPNREGQQPWQNRYTFCCFFGALALAVLLTYLVEKPCARRIKSRARRKKPLETRPEA